MLTFAFMHYPYLVWILLACHPYIFNVFLFFFLYTYILTSFVSWETYYRKKISRHQSDPLSKSFLLSLLIDNEPLDFFSLQRYHKVLPLFLFFVSIALYNISSHFWGAHFLRKCERNSSGGWRSRAIFFHRLHAAHTVPMWQVTLFGAHQSTPLH